MTQTDTTWKATADTVLDVRPDLEQGGEPFVRMMEAASAIQPGGTLVIIAPFEPVPLYDALADRSFTHETEKVADGEWAVRSPARREEKRRSAEMTWRASCQERTGVSGR